ncbi:MAG: nucleotidyltransferase family protein [Desulfocapsaceae bacterium]|jgi:glucose-1-phosphate thymidylyltransferase
MNAILLCAGFATRMYPLTRNFPKPLLPVGGRPVLDYLMDQVVALPCLTDVHLVSNGKFYDHFQRWYEHHRTYGDYSAVQVHIHDDGCFDNDRRLGAAGDLRLALERLERAGPTLVSGGDNIYQFSLAPLWKQFLQTDEHYIVALAETDKEKQRRTGVLEFGEGDRVIRLHEKPQEPPSSWVCPPLYFFQDGVLGALAEFLAGPADHDAPGHFIDYLCQTTTVRAFRLESTRLDIGSIQTYHEADLLMTQDLV